MSGLRRDLRTFVNFLAPSFNQTEPRDYFINSCCFGDDLARWFIGELQLRGVRVDAEPGQEDFGWYVCLNHNEVGYNLILAVREAEAGAGDWFASLEGPRTGSCFRRKNSVELPALELIHSILTQSDKISAVRWHYEKDWMAGREEGAAAPG